MGLTEKSFIYYMVWLFLTYVLWIFNGNIASDPRTCSNTFWGTIANFCNHVNPLLVVCLSAMLCLLMICYALSPATKSNKGMHTSGNPASVHQGSKHNICR